MRRRARAAIVAAGAALITAIAIPGAAGAAVFTNSTPITIPDSGNASLYPSPVMVSGIPAVGQMKVTIHDLSHDFLDDVGFVLVAPNNDALLLQDGVRDGAADNVTYTIADAGAVALPDIAALTPNQTYRPVGYNGVPSFPVPGPLTNYSHPGPSGGGSATFASTFGLDSGNGTWNLYVRDFVGGDGGSISGGWSLEVTPFDADPPETVITAGPFEGSTTADPTPVFSFTSDEPATFECRIDGGAFGPCTSGAELAPLAHGPHTFTVRAIDAALNVDGTPAVRSFRVDTSDPQTTITAGPGQGALINDASPAFSFSSSEAGIFQCRVDAGAFSACTSGEELAPPLADGTHTFRVRAIDSVLNEDPSPALRTFTVDATAPATTITAGPAEGATTSDATPAFSFGSSEPATFRCKVDAGAFAPCVSGADLQSLADGTHALQVKAVDLASNEAAVAVTRTFTVDAVRDTDPPETTITQAPKNSKKTKATVGFSSNDVTASLECSLNGGPFEPCTSPATVTGRKGKNTFSVRAVDAAGNADPTPATASWKVKKRRKN